MSRQESIAAVLFPCLQVVACIMIGLAILAWHRSGVSTSVRHAAVVGVVAASAAAFGTYTWLEVASEAVQRLGRKRTWLARYQLSFAIVFVISVLALLLHAHLGDNVVLALAVLIGLLGIFYAFLGLCWMGLLAVGYQLFVVALAVGDARQEYAVDSKIYGKALKARGVRFASLYFPVTTLLGFVTLVFAILLAIPHSPVIIVGFIASLSLTCVAGIITGLRAYNMPLRKRKGESWVRAWLGFLFTFASTVIWIFYHHR